MPSIPVTRTSVTVADRDRELHHPGQARQRRREQDVLRRIGKLSTRRIYPSRVIRAASRSEAMSRASSSARRRGGARRRAELPAGSRTQPDGSVEAVFEGEREAVERSGRFMREGPRGARVDWVDVVSEEPEGLSGFEVR